MLGKGKRYTRKSDVQMASAALLLAIWKLISIYSEYKKDSQKEGLNAHP